MDVVLEFLLYIYASKTYIHSYLFILYFELVTIRIEFKYINIKNNSNYH